MKKVLCGVLLILAICYACAFKEKEQETCEGYSRSANASFECYLHTAADSCRAKSIYLVNKALACDPSRPFNYWLKIRIYASMQAYDSVMLMIGRFEKINSGPDLMFTKGDVFRKLGNLDSARVFYKKSLLRYDELLFKDSLNQSLILGKLQVRVYLHGKERMREEVEFYTKKYGHRQDFDFLERVPALIDSTP